MLEGEGVVFVLDLFPVLGVTDYVGTGEYLPFNNNINTMNENTLPKR